MTKNNINNNTLENLMLFLDSFNKYQDNVDQSLYLLTKDLYNIVSNKISILCNNTSKIFI